jgi:hypothetical protein
LKYFENNKGSVLVVVQFSKMVSDFRKCTDWQYYINLIGKNMKTDSDEMVQDVLCYDKRQKIDSTKMKSAEIRIF